MFLAWDTKQALLVRALAWDRCWAIFCIFIFIFFGYSLAIFFEVIPWLYSLAIFLSVWIIGSKIKDLKTDEAPPEDRLKNPPNPPFILQIYIYLFGLPNLFFNYFI